MTYVGVIDGCIMLVVVVHIMQSIDVNIYIFFQDIILM